MKTVLIALLLFQATLQASESDMLRALDATWNDLRLTANVSGLERLLADDWLLTHSDGRVQNKKDYLDELRTGSRSNQAISNESVLVRLYGESAVITGTSVQSGVSNGQPWSGKFRFTRVWIRQSGQWLMAASHSSRIAGTK